MAFTPSSPVSGPNVAALATPTYTLTVDSPPAPNGKQYTVSALGGTQTNVAVHSISKPFTLSAFKPSVTKTLPPVNPVTGALPALGVNTFSVLVRKGVVPLTGQTPRVMLVRVSLEIPAGAELNDLPNVAAAISLATGAVYAQAAGLGTLVQDAVLG
jgi:hypothetical protein